MISKEKKNKLLKDLSLESFLILLSNEMPLNSIEFNQELQNPFKNVLQFIQFLKKDENIVENNYILNEELFESKIEFLLVHETIEFALNLKNPKLIEKKLEFISLLFDFGFYENALEYCQQLKQSFSDRLSSIQRRVIYEVESRFDYNIENHSELINDAVVNQNNQNNEINENNILSENPIETNLDNNYIETNLEKNDFYGELINDQKLSEFSFVSTPSIPVMPFDLMNDSINDSIITDNSIQRKDSIKQEFNENQIKKNDSKEEKTKQELTQNSNSNTNSGLFSTLFGKFRRKSYIIIDNNYVTIYLTNN
jgi:hypothetical protein